MEEYLRRYVVGIVADDAHLAAAEDCAEVEPEEVGVEQAPARVELGIVAAQVFDGLAVDLCHLEVVAVGNEIFGEHAHAGSDLEHGQCAGGRYGVGYAACYRLVGQEVLAEGLLGAHKSPAR